MTAEATDVPRFVVVGIGADGWAGLTDRARDELRGATVVYGSTRQLALLPALDATTVAWTSPMSEHLHRVVSEATAAEVHVLASGDPMFHGVGSTIVGAVGRDRVRILPTVSSASLACAELGWDLARTHVISTVHHEVESVVPVVTDGRRVLVLSRGAHTPSEVAEVLTRNGFGWSSMTVLEQLGGPGQRIVESLARSYRPQPHDALNIVAIECVGPRTSRLPGLPDDAYENDGQLTKSAVRALTVSALTPGGRALLWDIGSGSGSVAIEWLRADTEGSAIAFERDPVRAARLQRNAARHGVADRLTVRGGVPDSLNVAPEPDAVFVGGGLDDGVLTAAWQALLPGGRFVANAVTLDTQSLLVEWHARAGGTLRRLSIETVEPLGSLTTWRPALPIVQWITTRQDDQS